MKRGDILNKCKNNNMDEYFNNLGIWLKKLYDNSCDYYEAVSTDDSIMKKTLGEAKIKEMVGYVSDYIRALVDLGYIDDSNCIDIANRFMKLKVIGLLENYDDRVTGISDENKIFVNPDLPASCSLTRVERCRLYVCKQLTKFLHKEWQNSIKDYIDNIQHGDNRDLLIGVNCTNLNFVKEGFALLDEAISQDVAENIAYYIAKKERPPKCINSDERLFNGIIYKSNFDTFSGIEDPAVKFGRTLSFIRTSTFDSNDKVLRKLSIRGFDSEFVSSIVEEYDEDIYKQKDFFDMMLSMGRIMDACRSIENGDFGNRSVYFSSCYLIGLDQISNKYLTDSRESVKVKAAGQY